jgi:hypothetical protein
VNGNARLLAVLLEIDRDGAEAVHQRVLDQPVEDAEAVVRPYVFGTYADGSYAVSVPYSVLKPILAADGPLGSLR